MAIEDVFGQLAEWLLSEREHIELPPPGAKGVS
jgi:hypothetical protein